MATTEGSLITIPWPLTYTKVFAVPRSMPRSLEKAPNILLNIKCCYLRCYIFNFYLFFYLTGSLFQLNIRQALLADNNLQRNTDQISIKKFLSGRNLPVINKKIQLL